MSISQITGGGSSVSAVEPRQDVKSTPKLSTSTGNASAGSIAATEESKQTAAVSSTALKQSVDEINRFINSSNSVNLNLDSGSGKVVVQIVDRETNAVIRQIPSAEVLSIAKDLSGKKGLLLNDQA
ncbi:flagellar protein FlaG [Undibacterium sp. TJN19]|uniref:flagellar protein FlaG n=1 Tax=Undibacterium sp. TJN19 TaxID=3413055 RepID=UPI003BF07266